MPALTQQLNREYVRRLWEAYRHFFSAPKNTAFIHFNLKQEQSILRETGDVEVTLKMSKLMSRVVEEMTYCLRKRNTELDILKDVHFMRRTWVLMQSSSMSSCTGTCLSNSWSQTPFPSTSSWW